MRNFLSEMLYALTSAYTRRDYENVTRGAPPETNIGKLFSIFSWGLDTVKEQAELIRLWDNLDNARGSVLDRYGMNFGVKRFGDSDELYRLAIRVKVMSQLSGGDTDTVIRAAAELLGVKYEDITFEDVFPAKIALYVDWILLTEERRKLIVPIAYSIKRILAAGVGMRIYMRTHHVFRSELIFVRCGYAASYIFAAPAVKGRESNHEVTVGYYTVRTARVKAASPNVWAIHEEHRNGAGGAVCITHIKAKRIE